MRLAATAAFLAAALVAAPFTSASAQTCTDVATVHAVLDVDLQRHGGEIIAFNGAEAQAFADEILERTQQAPVASVTLVLVHRVNAVADVVIFVEGCAQLRGLLPRVIFDAVYGRTS